MSKKKRRFLKKKRASSKSPHCKDVHHLCYQKRHWVHGSAMALRNFHYTQIRIPKNTLHHQIHVEVEHVPEPKDESAAFALEQLHILEGYGAISDDDPIEKRLNLLASLFDYSDQPTADGFRAQLKVVYQFKNKPP